VILIKEKRKARYYSTFGRRLKVHNLLTMLSYVKGIAF
jgi:hypothetical protein